VALERSVVAGQVGGGGVEFFGEKREGPGDAGAVRPVQGDGDGGAGVVDLAEWSRLRRIARYSFGSNR
jgi:hypothetical protein